MDIDKILGVIQRNVKMQNVVPLKVYNVLCISILYSCLWTTQILPLWSSSYNKVVVVLIFIPLLVIIPSTLTYPMAYA